MWLENTDIFSQAELEDVMYNNANRIYFKPSNVEAAAKAEDPVYKKFKETH